MKLRRQIKEWMKWDTLSFEERHRRVEKYLPYLQGAARAAGAVQLDMRAIALLSLTDKVGAHEYTDAYARHFSPFRNKKINLLEIGVGGYKHEPGGRSLVLWNAYFQRANIVAIDIEDKTSLSRGRIKVYQCSQTDEAALTKICDDYNGFDIIIDDGSHVSEHMIRSFEILFPRLKAGGVYVIEDLQGTYLENYGGGPLGTIGYEKSTMKYLRSIVDVVNMRSADLKEVTHVSPLPSFIESIKSIHFYEELCIIYKS